MLNLPSVSDKSISSKGDGERDELSDGEEEADFTEGADFTPSTSGGDAFSEGADFTPSSSGAGAFSEGADFTPSSSGAGAFSEGADFPPSSSGGDEGDSEDSSGGGSGEGPRGRGADLREDGDGGGVEDDDSVSCLDSLGDTIVLLRVLTVLAYASEWAPHRDALPFLYAPGCLDFDITQHALECIGMRCDYIRGRALRGKASVTVRHAWGRHLL